MAFHEAIEAELFANRLTGVATEMGEMLRRMSLSTNVKERLDFSCAVLDADGYLLVNAPHIPVHLGALGMCVRSVAAAMQLAPGDVVVTNHPGHGGSHLPDVTFLSPVFESPQQLDGASRLCGYVANRAHHAELGGVLPGSMPPTATNLAEEGVVLPPMKVVEAGVSRWDRLEAALRGGPHPSRSVDENLADSRAAVASLRRGEALIRGLLEQHGLETYTDRARFVRSSAARRMAAALSRLDDGTRRATEQLDDGTCLAVEIFKEGDRAVIDFSGSGAQHPGNLNATPAIVTSAVLYVLRLVLDEELPLNEGLLEPVDLIVPSGILSPSFEMTDATRCPAVVGGNVETSQRVVDVLLKAFGLAACSQGTMNNVVFGNDDFGYYETIAGGAGATPRRAGADAVHTHMTNTLITDPEILEQRYPVRLETFRVRRGSGGRGRHRGGDGVTRVLRFVEPVELSVLTQHRVQAPYGMDGGEAGSVGRQWIESPDGVVKPLSPVDTARVGAGSRLVIETPGGGGWGQPSS